jgi:hypothetical protein
MDLFRVCITEVLQNPNGQANSDIFIGVNYNQQTGQRLAGTNHGVAQIQLVGGNAQAGAVKIHCLAAGTGAVSSIPTIMTVNPTGVGIGTTSPACPLDVQATASVSLAAGYYFNSGTSSLTSFGGGNQSISIRGSQGIQAATYLATSDARIKNVEPSSPKCLDTLNALKVREYTYIDKASDPRKKIGFVAQEVEEVLPNTITKDTRIVPNVFKPAESVSSNVVTLTNHGVTVGTKVKLVKWDNSEIVSNVVQVSDTTFQVEDTLTEDKIFVYGTEVSDFRNIDYNQVFSLAVGAIQELSAENTALKTRLDSLEARLAAVGF